jgi:phosphohistidine phosphatase SixA
VGHEPALGDVASWLLTGRKGGFLEMKKGGAALIDFGRRVAPGRGRLLWSIPPRGLARLADG